MIRTRGSIAKACAGTMLFAAWLLGFQMSEKINQTKAGVAIKGYDPVAYFEDGKPAKGDPANQYQWKGAAWQFSSAAHREAFAKDPEHYAPQYGGFCAYGVSEGHTAPINPEAWSIIDGKLYLNYDKQVQAEWKKDTKSRIRKADQNWPKLSGR
jgi:YHS domain-containing protein